MIGQTVSHYKIIEELGGGGMGVVYLAEDTKLNRAVALKFLPPELTRDKDAKTRFVLEAQAASSLDHPNICTVHEIDETPDGRMFICMAYYEGETLQQRVKRGVVRVEDALEISLQVAEGLGRAHEEGIIHRDVKSANIVVTNRGEAKIVDFGLAKFTGQAGLTKTGTVVGTAAYMSPEQARGEEVDSRTDIWSLGVVLYQMIAGELPFKGEYEHAIVYSIINETPCSVRSLCPDTPDDLNATIDKALAKNPNERYQSMRDFIADLQTLKLRVESRVTPKPPDDAENLPSIAVLPFVNMSPDPENAYFGDGLAEELINALTQLKGMRVAARTSAFRFRGREVDIREIGQKLNVRAVLEGSVRKAGNRLRVTAQLINVEDGYHLWSDRYDRDMEDVFAIQDEITAAIVKQLEVKLMSRTTAPLIKRHTENLDAYSMYLKAHYYLFTLTPEGWQKSFELYQKAVELDPAFALPYVSLSQIHQSQCFWGDSAPKEAMPKSLAAAERALELDDGLPLAHSVVAVVRWSYDWDWEGAEREFKRVFELDPTEPFNHINYSLFLAAQGRFEEALAEAKLGQKLDPLSSVIAAWAGIAPASAGLHDESIKTLEHAITLDPNHWQPYVHLCTAYLHASMIDEAVAAGAKAVELTGGASVALKTMAAACYVAGKIAKADELFEKLIDRSKSTYVAPSFFAQIHHARGEPDKALDYLRKAIHERDSWLIIMRLNPPPIRPAGPEVDALLEKVGPRRL